MLLAVDWRDSCGKSGIGETPQERTRRGGSPAPPRKAKPCTEFNSDVTSHPY
ncbi:hypothetical protein M4B17_06135 [Priestia aryabhattai]|nr:hypothetical protein [Priestia aryabhattai]